jgi:hypothetical protein
VSAAADGDELGAAGDVVAATCGATPVVAAVEQPFNLRCFSRVGERADVIASGQCSQRISLSVLRLAMTFGLTPKQGYLLRSTVGYCHGRVAVDSIVATSCSR